MKKNQDTRLIIVLAAFLSFTNCQTTKSDKTNTTQNQEKTPTNKEPIVTPNKPAKDFPNIYLCAAKGLLISKDGGKSFVNKTKANSGLVEDIDQNIEVDAAGTLYVASSKGVSVSKDGGETFVNYKIQSAKTSMGHGPTYGIGVDPSGTLYIATAGGLYVSKDGGKSFDIDIDKNFGEHGLFAVTRIVADTAGTIFIGTRDGLFISRDSGKSFEKKGLANGLPAKDALGLIAAGPAGTLYLELFVPEHGKSTTVIYNTSIGLWGTNDGGKSFAPVEAFGKASSDLNKLTALVVDPTGTVYVGTLNGIFISKNGGKNFVKKDKKNGLADTFVRGISADSKGNIVVGRVDGLSISTDGGETFQDIPNISWAGINRNNCLALSSEKAL